MIFSKEKIAAFDNFSLMKKIETDRQSILKNTQNREMSQPNFNHPELIVPSVPQEKWTINNASTDDFGSVVLTYHSPQKKLQRGVFLDENFVRFQESFTTGPKNPRLIANVQYSLDGFIIEQHFFEDGKTVKYRKATGDRILEEWFDVQGRTTAARRTANGALDGEPAVVIHRPNDTTRHEFWTSGVLQKVTIADTKTGAVLVVQEWKDGKCKLLSAAPGYALRVQESDLVFPLSKQEEAPVTPAKAFKLIPAAQAREELSNDDERIQQILDDFETQRQKGLPRDERRFSISIPGRLQKRVAEILREAGYTVTTYNLFFWVEY
jgi:hypothetical protein